MATKEQIVDSLMRLARDLQAEIESEKDEPMTVYDLRPEDKCWIISGKGSVMEYNCSFAHFKKRLEKGDVFLTKERAQAELKQRQRLASHKLGGFFVYED